VSGADDARPLAGATVVVTRAADAGDGLRAALCTLGARVVDCPVTRVETLDPAPFDAEIAAPAAIDWLVFSSPRAVERAFTRAQAIGIAPERFAHCRIGVVGEATGGAVRAWGLVPTVTPARYVAEALVEALAARADVAGARIVFPVAAGARTVLAEGLAALGADVRTVALYRSVPDPAPAAALAARLRAGAVHAVTFAAASAVRSFVEGAGEAAACAPAVSIGPITTQALTAAGLPVAAEAVPSTLDGLAGAVVRAVHATRATAAPDPIA
jgi:uroporphyrinogen-III synthase